jgi:hypothetical protein
MILLPELWHVRSGAVKCLIVANLADLLLQHCSHMRVLCSTSASKLCYHIMPASSGGVALHHLTCFSEPGVGAPGDWTN